MHSSRMRTARSLTISLGGGHAWQGACVAGSVHGKGACMAGGGGGHVWQWGVRGQNDRRV